MILLLEIGDRTAEVRPAVECDGAPALYEGHRLGCAHFFEGDEEDRHRRRAPLHAREAVDEYTIPRDILAHQLVGDLRRPELKIADLLFTQIVVNRESILGRHGGVEGRRLRTVEYDGYIMGTQEDSIL